MIIFIILIVLMAVFIYKYIGCTEKTPKSINCVLRTLLTSLRSSTLMSKSSSKMGSSLKSTVIPIFARGESQGKNYKTKGTINTILEIPLKKKIWISMMTTSSWTNCHKTNINWSPCSS